MAECANAITSSWINTENYSSDTSVGDYVISSSLNVFLGQVFHREQTPYGQGYVWAGGTAGYPKTVTL